MQDYHEYVEIQTDAALRNLAMAYPYDTNEDEVLSLRGDIEEARFAIGQTKQTFEPLTGEDKLLA